MKPEVELTIRFVEFIPDELQAKTLYISMEYATAAHQCPCGCGTKVVTPLSPIQWSLYFDGRAVTLSPSIGNWEFPCRSHYWIKKNRVQWAPQWTKEQINRGREREELARSRYLSKDDVSDKDRSEQISGLRAKVRHWLRRK